MSERLRGSALCPQSVKNEHKMCDLLPWQCLCKRRQSGSECTICRCKSSVDMRLTQSCSVMHWNCPFHPPSSWEFVFLCTLTHWTSLSLRGKYLQINEHTCADMPIFITHRSYYSLPRCNLTFLTSWLSKCNGSFLIKIAIKNNNNSWLDMTNKQCILTWSFNCGFCNSNDHRESWQQLCKHRQKYLPKQYKESTQNIPTYYDSPQRLI